MTSNSAQKHFVAVIGGAVSGSVTAEILADNGIEVVVIEQNPRPYGKIEDGLPRWHNHQRRKEYERIDARLTKEGLHYLPNTKLGRDVAFKDLTENWGLSAVILANGAWRDRPIGVEGEFDYEGKGIEYQNPFIYWFNHKNEKEFAGRQIHIPDGAAVIGGGLASIDCLKVCQLELYDRALRERGIEVDMLELEKKGIPDTCRKHGIEPEELGLKNSIMVYRRRTVDMPLATPPPNATPEQMEKTIATRQKLLSRAQERYLFRVQDKTLTQSLIIEDGVVKGLNCKRTHVEGRTATPLDGTEHEIRTDMIISSIGSVPEKIDGINMKGEYYTYKDWDLGIYEGAEGVFAVGNTVTGQGNIRTSLLHAKSVSKYLMENYFAGAVGAAGAGAVNEYLEQKEPLSAEKIRDLRVRVKELQARAGYDGDYHAWMKRVTPPDLE
jgi:NADPH-dependent glutamate synthase beta subunit-like oxidoreductase